MSLVIQSNLPSMQAQRNLAMNSAELSKSFNKLSSGYRINSSADDAAGLAISEGMKSRISSYTVAERNALDAISMTQTAEGALEEVHGVLGRMRELAMRAANGSLSVIDRSFVQSEFQLLQEQIRKIQESVTFNGNRLINQTAGEIVFQIGLDNTASDQVSITFGGMDLSALLNSAAVSGATTSQSLAALGIIDAALTEVSTTRARFGAVMNSMEITTSNLQTMRLNTSAANSRIRDVDVADETSAMSRNQVLTQAGVSVLAQASQLPQMALQLISG